MSKKASRASLIASVMEGVAAFQDSTDLVDSAAARVLALNRTDLRCLGILTRGGAMPAGRLAAASGLSPGAITTAVDRLVRSGYAQRVPDTLDRRKVLVVPTPRAHEVSEEIWGPIGRTAYESLIRRSDQELRIIEDFLREGRALLAQQAERVRTMVDT